MTAPRAKKPAKAKTPRKRKPRVRKPKAAAPAAKSENPGENPKPEVGTLRPSPTGTGMILYGSKPGKDCPATGHGRPPNAFKALMQELGNRPLAIKTLEEILDGARGVVSSGGLMLVDGRLFLDAHKYVTDRGYGKVEREQDASPPDRKPLVVRLIHEVRSA